MAAPDSDLLGRVELFSGLDDEARAAIAERARTEKAEAGTVFFREGEPASRFFALETGRIKFTQISAEGHEVILRFIGAGEPFGGVAAFDETAVYPVTATAVEPSSVLVWDGAVMTALMRRFPELAINAGRMVAARLHELQRQHRELMTERVERRIARALLRLATLAGRRVDAGVEIDFPISRQDLAQMTGSTLFTVSRTLSGWEADGIVASGRRRITITQPHRLVGIAEDLPG